MLQELITSKTRIRLLFMFFLNQENTSYLRELEQELHESTNSIRLELAKLEELNLINSFKHSNRKYYQANKEHAFFPDIRNMLLKEIGFDDIKCLLYREITGLLEIYVTGSYARGKGSDNIDLVLVGNRLNTEQICRCIEEIEPVIKKKIRFITLQKMEPDNFFEDSKMFRI